MMYTQFRKHVWLFCFILWVIGCGGDSITTPHAPLDLKAEVGDQSVKLTWSSASGGEIEGYFVYRSLYSGGDYQRLTLIPLYTGLADFASDEPAYEDTGLKNGTTYYYVVTAVDDRGNESPFSSEIYATPNILKEFSAVINMLVIHSAPDVLYAATDEGLFKTRDGGFTWENLSPGLKEIESLAITEAEPPSFYISLPEQGILCNNKGSTDNISWIFKASLSQVSLIKAAPSLGGNQNFLYAVSEMRLYVSRDGGVIWELLPNSPKDITALDIYTKDPDILYVGTKTGDIYLSKDGGMTWEQISKTNKQGINDLAVYPENPAILYITTTSGTLLKTMDSCRSWEFLSNSMGDYTKVAISKTKPEILYVYNEDFFYSTLYKSKDGGSSWEQIDAQQIVKNK